MEFEVTDKELTVDSFLEEGVLFVHKDEILIKDNVLKIDFSTSLLRVLNTRRESVGVVIRSAEKRFKIGKFILGKSEIFTRKYSDFLIVKEK